jgi:hypothetical protein
MEQSEAPKTPSEPIILLISGTCCFPQMAGLDQQAKKVINQALEETGIKAQVRTVTASSAVQGGIPLEILKTSGLAADVSNIMRLPAVLINNRLISFGIPKLDEIKNALIHS